MKLFFPMACIMLLLPACVPKEVNDLKKDLIGNWIPISVAYENCYTPDDNTVLTYIDGCRNEGGIFDICLNVSFNDIDRYNFKETTTVSSMVSSINDSGIYIVSEDFVTLCRNSGGCTTFKAQLSKDTLKFTIDKFAITSCDTTYLLVRK
jgi:hypothetical protein